MSVQQIICGVLAMLVGWAIEQAMSPRPAAVPRPAPVPAPRHPACETEQQCRVVAAGPCRRVDRFTVLCPRKKVCETRRHCR